MGGITVMGGKSSPVGAAAAMLKDLINAFSLREDRRRLYEMVA
jgi:hypothetical protein